MSLVILVTGVRAAGKHTVCQLISERLPVVDDCHIETLAKEEDITRLAAALPQVLAPLVLIIDQLGAAQFWKVPADMHIDGKLYIDAPLDLCLLRQMRQHQQVHLLDGYEKQRSLIQQRQAALKQAADIVIENQQDIADIDVAALLQLLQTQHSTHPVPQPLALISPTFDAATFHRTYQGKLFVLSGPSGVGKDTLINRVLASVPKLESIVSYTTRPKREGELDGRDYHFVSQERFAQLITTSVFLQYFHDDKTHNHYGVLLQDVQDKLCQGISVIIHVYPNTLATIKQHQLPMTSVFICPPSFTGLMQRLASRPGGVDPLRVQHALSIFEDEMMAQFDYLIINDELEVAVTQLSALLMTNTLSLSAMCVSEAEHLSLLSIERGVQLLRQHCKLPDGVMPTNMTKLSSLNNASFRLELVGNCYFLRMPAKGERIFTVPVQNEQSNLLQVSPDFYPQPIFFDHSGIYAATFLPFSSVASLEINETLLQSMSARLKQLHAMPSFANDYNPINCIEESVFRISQHNVALPVVLPTLIVFAKRLMDSLALVAGERRPCNNDMSPYNMLLNNDELIITDWECSGNNYPMWDLAKLSVELKLDEINDKLLLKHYKHADPDTLDLAQLMLFKFIVELHLALWSKWQIVTEHHVFLKDAFARMFRIRLQNCRHYLHSETFRQYVDRVLAIAVLREPALPKALVHSRMQSSLAATSKSTAMITSPIAEQAPTKLFCHAGQSRALVVVKPDAMLNQKLGAILMFLEQHQFSLVALKICCMTTEMVRRLYSTLPGHRLEYDVLDMFTAGPVCLIAVQGDAANIDGLSRLKGATDPTKAAAATLRRQFGWTAKWNAVHCSDQGQGGREVDLFFSQTELSAAFS